MHGGETALGCSGGLQTGVSTLQYTIEEDRLTRPVLVTETAQSGRVLSS